MLHKTWSIYSIMQMGFFPVSLLRHPETRRERTPRCSLSLSLSHRGPGVLACECVCVWARGNKMHAGFFGAGVFRTWHFLCERKLSIAAVSSDSSADATSSLCCSWDQFLCCSSLSPPTSSSQNIQGGRTYGEKRRAQRSERERCRSEARMNSSTSVYYCLFSPFNMGEAQPSPVLSTIFFGNGGLMWKREKWMYK